MPAVEIRNNAGQNPLFGALLKRPYEFQREQSKSCVHTDGTVGDHRHQAVSNELAQAGLELVPTNMPIEMLLVEKN
jgi:hypothetical protein